MNFTHNKNTTTMKTSKQYISQGITTILLVTITIIGFYSCKSYMDGQTFIVSDERMIDEYIEEENPQTMSKFLRLS